MGEKVYIRRNFADIDIVNTPYIVYDLYLKMPSSIDFRYGELRTIVLRNRNTGRLERLQYQLSGAVASVTHPGYQWYWGDIRSTDYRCALVFSFDAEGRIDQIVASFYGDSPDVDEFKELTKNSRFPAEFTARDCFRKR